jgi:membrane-associated phospholipid phosphatase
VNHLPSQLLTLLAGATLLLSPAPAVADSSNGEVEAAPGTPEARNSIYRYNLWVDIPVVAIGALGTAVPYIASWKFVTPSCPCDRSSINFIDRGSVDFNSHTAGVIGDVLVSLAVAAPVVYEAVAVRPLTTLIEDMVVYTEVIAVNGGLVALSKFVVQRPTPRSYAGDPKVISEPGGYLSFYSGHTSFAFATLSFGAMTIGARHQRYLVPWLVTGLVGTGVGTAMVLGGAHFPTDVMMGAAAGSAVGILVPFLHLRAPRELRFAVLPGPGGLPGLSVMGRF